MAKYQKNTQCCKWVGGGISNDIIASYLSSCYLPKSQYSFSSVLSPSSFHSLLFSSCLLSSLHSRPCHTLLNFCIICVIPPAPFYSLLRSLSLIYNDYIVAILLLYISKSIVHLYLHKVMHIIIVANVSIASYLNYRCSNRRREVI